MVQNEVAMFDRLRDYFLDKHAYSNIRRHKTSVSLVSELQYNIPPHPKNDNFRFAVELLIKHNGKYLLCKRSSDAKIAPGIWNIPAGKVKYNEGIEEALIRECAEETNLKVSNVSYLDYNFINKEHKRIVYLYVTEVADISDLRIDDGEFDEWEWIKAEDVDNYESVNPFIKRWLSELG
ncbi:NUDIX hydrolase [Lactococcus piscium]|nr:NUDIX hydrolase [Lactococcus piscium]